MEDIDIWAQDLIKNLDPDILRLLKRGNLLRQFLREVLINDAIKHINIPSKNVEKAIKKFYEDKRLNDINTRKIFLVYRGLNEGDLHTQILLPLKIKKFCSLKFKNRLDSHFLKNKEKHDQFIYSIIRVDNSNLAHELYLQIEAEEVSFSILANKYSIEKNIFKNGLVGPSSIMKCHPLLRKAIRSSIPGELNKPFQIENSWIILRLEEIKPAKLDSTMEVIMMSELFEIYIQEKINKVIRNLLKRE